MRFTIRDLLWLTVVVALAVAWWMDRQQLASEIDTLRFYLGVAPPNSQAPAENLPYD